MTQCKKTNCLIAVLAVFAFMFLFDKFFHNCSWMMEQYKQTFSLWRTEDSMREVFPWFFARYALLALAITCLYKKLCHCAPTASCQAKEGEAPKKCCPYMKGMCFGATIGVIIGTVQASSYIWMPIPENLAIAWFVGAVVQGLGVGLILALVLGKKKGSCEAE